jgi:hypothetical protein
MSRRLISIGLLSLATAGFVGVAPVSATADASASGMAVTNSAGSVAVSAPSAAALRGTVAPNSTSPYPSSSSTIVGSVGFIDSEQVGYFWSASRGDSVTESLSGPNKVKKAKLALDVVQNALNSGAHVDWTLSINGTDVGSFQINEGQLGAVNQSFSFPKITGGTYVVKLRVTNEVAGGEGSHTWRYAGDGPHSIKLKRR